MSSPGRDVMLIVVVMAVAVTVVMACVIDW